MSWGWREREGHGHCKAPLLSAQDEAHAEAFRCWPWHFQGKLSLTMTRDPSMEVGACQVLRKGLTPSHAPPRDADPTGTSRTSL